MQQVWRRLVWVLEKVLNILCIWRGTTDIHLFIYFSLRLKRYKICLVGIRKFLEWGFACRSWSQWNKLKDLACRKIYWLNPSVPGTLHDSRCIHWNWNHEGGRRASEHEICWMPFHTRKQYSGNILGLCFIILFFFALFTHNYNLRPFKNLRSTLCTLYIP